MFRYFRLCVGWIGANCVLSHDKAAEATCFNRKAILNHECPFETYLFVLNCF